MTARSTPDWERIEANYRAGTMSLREIAAADGNVTEGAIRKRAKRDDWTRDLGPKIQAKADALVRSKAVRSEVRSTSAASERETIEANAKAIADVRLGHRTDIRAGRDLVAKLLEELRGVTERPDLIEDLIQALAGDEGEDGDEDAAKKRAKRVATLREMLDRLTSLPGRVAAVKGLSEALRNLIGLEREAWGIDAKEKDPGELDDLADEELDRRIEARLAKLNASAAE